VVESSECFCAQPAGSVGWSRSCGSRSSIYGRCFLGFARQDGLESMLTSKVCHWHLNHQSCLQTGEGSQCCTVSIRCLWAYCVGNGGHHWRFTDGYVTCLILSPTSSSFLTCSCSIASWLALTLLGSFHLRRFRICSRILPHSGLWRRNREKDFPI
jgi:WD40 repeat protein